MKHETLAALEQRVCRLEAENGQLREELKDGIQFVVDCINEDRQALHALVESAKAVEGHHELIQKMNEVIVTHRKAIERHGEALVRLLRPTAPQRPTQFN